VASPANTRLDASQAIEALESQLARTPRASRPYEHAALAYRLGLAYAESPVGSREQNLRKALASFDVAASVFNARLDPVEHARVLNAAGASHRALGNRTKAAELFAKAVELLDGRDRDSERAAALNNLGLVRTELGQFDEAVAAFEVAVDLFDTTTDEGRRGRVAALVNRGQAHAATGTAEGLEAALSDYDDARVDLDPDAAPYHDALVHHSIGAACLALAKLQEPERERLLRAAAEAFATSLTVFTRTGFPYQHALAEHNQGLTHLALGEHLRAERAAAPPPPDDEDAGPDPVLLSLRRALACFEEAIAVLDTRVHADAWRQTYNSLTTAEKALEELAPGFTRAEHFAHLVADADQSERDRLVRDRVLRLLSLPQKSGLSAIGELAYGVARLGEERAEPVIESELMTVMELPNDRQELLLRATYEATRGLPEEAREAADRALDTAIGMTLQGPQRISVRDFLYSLGWERP
jgi:tetratricopeptide (TPR) repeat protein